MATKILDYLANLIGVSGNPSSREYLYILFRDIKEKGYHVPRGKYLYNKYRLIRSRLRELGVLKMKMDAFKRKYYTLNEMIYYILRNKLYELKREIDRCEMIMHDLIVNSYRARRKTQR